MNNKVARYKSKLKRKLQCNRGTKAKLLEEFSPLMDGFLDENPDATYTDLSNAFGPPEEMAKILMDKVDEQEKRAYKLRQLLLRIAAAVLAIVLVIVTITVFFWKEKPIDAVDGGEVVDSFEVVNDFDVVDSFVVNEGE